MAVTLDRLFLNMSLFGKPWKEIFSLRKKIEKLDEDDESHKLEEVSVGDMVMFCVNPPEHKDHCNIWQWATGILIDVNRKTREAHILSDGEVYIIKNEWVGPLDMLEGPKKDK